MKDMSIQEIDALFGAKDNMDVVYNTAAAHL